MSQLQDSLFIITGAASGIGRAVAVQAAAAGAQVLATDKHAAGLAQTQALVAAGGRLVTAQLDVADASQIEAFAAQVASAYPGQRLILFNNAGVALGAGTFEENEQADFDWVLNVNLYGVIRMTKAFLPLMRARGAGHVVNVSSVFGLFGMPESAAYSTAKFGVRGFTEALRHELRGSGIQVSTVFPGGVRTNIAASARLGAGRTPEQQALASQRFARSARTTPEAAARRILRGIRAGRGRILVGPDAYLIDWLTRLAPGLVGRLLLPWVRRAIPSAPAARR